MAVFDTAQRKQFCDFCVAFAIFAFCPSIPNTPPQFSRTPMPLSANPSVKLQP